MNSREIPMPSESEKRAAIDKIIDAGMPRRRSNASMLLRIFRSLGLRGLFFDSADAVTLSLLCSAVVLAVFVGVIDNGGSYTMTAAAAPALYLLLFGISRWKWRTSGIEQIRCTCVFTPVHICIAQSMLFSLAGLVFGGLLAGLMPLTHAGGDVPGLLCTALASQLVCSAVTMLTIDRRCRLLPDIAAAGCAGAGLLLVLLRQTGIALLLEQFIARLSAAVMAGAASLCLALYLLAVGGALSRSSNILKGELI